MLASRRGQGIAKKLGAALDERTRADFPSVKRIRSVVQDKNLPIMQMHEKQVCVLSVSRMRTRVAHQSSASPIPACGFTQGYKRLSLTAMRFGAILKPLHWSAYSPEELNVKRSVLVCLYACVCTMRGCRCMTLTTWLP